MPTVELADLVASLKRTVAIPGAFDTTFPTPTTPDLIGALGDGFAEAQLDGFFTSSYGGVDYSFDPTTEIVTPALTQGQGALVVIYAASRWVNAMLLNLKNRQKFAAKGADYDTEQSATLLTTLLKQMNDRKLALQQKALYSGYASAFSMADGYFLAATGRYALPADFGGYYDADRRGV